MGSPKKRTILSEQTKANLKVAEVIKITPQSKSSPTEYCIILVGKTGKTAYVEDRDENVIIYKSISAAKKHLGQHCDPKKIMIVSQLSI